MVSLTAEDIREWSLVDFVGRGFPVPVGADPDTLQVEVDRASAYVEMATGLVIDDITDPSTTATLVKQAIQQRTEQRVIWGSDDYVGDQNESAIDISVTGYSQRRVSSKEQSPRDMVNPWPELNSLLISLMTEEKLDYWRGLGAITGGNGVAEVITEHGWFEE